MQETTHEYSMQNISIPTKYNKTKFFGRGEIFKNMKKQKQMIYLDSLASN